MPAANRNKQEKTSIVSEEVRSSAALYVLGTVQDAGSPHIDCQKECCSDLFEHSDVNRKVVSLGVVDHDNGKSFLFEATQTCLLNYDC